MSFEFKDGDNATLLKEEGTDRRPEKETNELLCEEALYRDSEEQSHIES